MTSEHSGPDSPEAQDASDERSTDATDSGALPAYLRELIRRHRQEGGATADWEVRIAARVAVLEAVLDDGNR